MPRISFGFNPCHWAVGAIWSPEVQTLTLALFCVGVSFDFEVAGWFWRLTHRAASPAAVAPDDEIPF